MEKSVKIRVPATSANCGPGFDCLGVACTMYNELSLTLKKEPGVEIQVEGEGAENIPTDERNLAWRSIQTLLRRAKADDTYRGASIRMKNGVPLSRGLGSSAAAIVGALKAANVALGNPYDRRGLLQIATDLEGHPDNVAPAIYGGFTVSLVQDGVPESFSFLPRLPLKMVVAIPAFHLSTKAARDALPANVPMKDAVFNVGRAAMLVGALAKGNETFLRHAFEDALHQPYRAKLIPGMYEVFDAAREAGTLGVAMSGAGPCIIAYTTAHAEAVGDAMVETFRRHEVEARAVVLGVEERGAYIVKE
ncbi:MAG: homoserine kinase [Schwartzia sp.]|nr:homoserine kinase [Schwartzia sp. (in: firmicutes)]